METSAQLNEAWDLLFGGRFRDSLIPFSQAAGDFRWAAEALYGMGVAQLSLHEDVYAEAALWDSLQRAPLNAEALFYLGLIAERRGRREEAIGRYRETLAMAAGHAGAKVRLAAVLSGSSVRPSVVPLPASRPPAPQVLARPAAPMRPPGPGSEPIDIEEVERLQRAVALSARPRAIAYLGSLDPEVLAPLPVHPATALLLAAFWFGLALLRSALPFLAAFITVLQVAAGAGAVLQVLGLALTGARAARMRVTIRHRHVRVERDLLKPGAVASMDLAEVDSVELRRTGLQALTGDGTLALRGRDGTLLLCGVARGSRLTHLYRQLLELVEYLHGW
jgi:tetratricopeptide (TPR) repeat protein